MTPKPRSRSVKKVKQITRDEWSAVLWNSIVFKKSGDLPWEHAGIHFPAFQRELRKRGWEITPLALKARKP